MNATNDNTGGYPATLMREWLEGAGGDGTGAFAEKLKESLGGNYLYTLRQNLSTKGNNSWVNTTVFLSSEYNVFGSTIYDELLYGDALFIHFPIYAKSAVFRIKRFNGERAWWWESSPDAADAISFVTGRRGGDVDTGDADDAYGGVSPAFCAA
jgi:hypothetical protein